MYANTILEDELYLLDVGYQIAKHKGLVVQTAFTNCLNLKQAIF